MIKKEKKDKKDKKEKVKSKKQLIKKLDDIFSKYVRLFYTDKYWNVKCYTCGKVMQRKEAQNWHFKTRWWYKTRRDFENCKVQCVGCNVFKHWNYQIYTIKMINEHWKERVENLLNNKEISNFSYKDLEEKYTYYKKEVDKLLILLN